MKKILSLLVLGLAFSSILIAQQIPQGMKYQAVARNLKGEILANEKITLRISLNSLNKGNAKTHYSETHDLITNEVGLFTLVIGEGKSEKLKFTEIPWSTEDIWMQVAIGDKGKGGFTDISYSKLMTVPYAFHAGTATRLSGNQNIQKTEGSPNSANTWSLPGNLSSNPDNDYVGTADNVGLSFRTYATERMWISNNGDLSILNNVNLNTASGHTFNKGNLRVDGTTNLNDVLIVNNTKATNLTGSLTVGKLVALNDVTESTTKDDGALVVEGGVGIEKSLNVGGALNVTGLATLKNLAVDGVTGKSINITDNSQGYLATFINTNEDNDGDAGDGIKIQLGKERPLNLNGFTLPTYNTFFPGITNAIKNSLFNNGAFNTSITANTLFDNLKTGALSDFQIYGDFIVAGLCNLTNKIVQEVNTGITKVNTALTLPYNLATPLNTGLGLPKNISSSINTALGLPKNLSQPINNGLGLPITSADAFGILDIFGGATIVPALPALSIPAVPALTIPAMPDLILPAIPAIPTIPNCPPLVNPFAFALNFPTVSANPLTKNNEFIGFFDKDGVKVGAIRGQSMQDLVEELTDIPTLVSVATSLFIAFDFDGSTAHTLGFVKVGARLLSYVVNTWDKAGKIGVEYSSGNGDYAEWLERENPSEQISTGDIVAVKGGKITKDIEGAEQIMAVSHRPIVLGNVPDAKLLPYGNNIAFMGQIPVKVMGPVKAGDYIVAKSEVSGYGIAVDPLNMGVEDYKLTVGRSWTTDVHQGPKMVNTVVGVHNNNFLDLIKDLKEKTDENDARLKAIEAKLDITSDVNYSKEKKAFK